MSGEREIALRDLALCFEGAVPAVIATAGADGSPNVTHLSRVRIVDDERVALSNQFLSKTASNLAENPRASVLVLDPVNYDQYRLSLVYERTDRRGPLFDRLREDVDAVASLGGMQAVFKLRAADVYRVIDIQHVLAAVHRRGEASVAMPSGRTPDLRGWGRWRRACPAAATSTRSSRPPSAGCTTCSVTSTRRCRCSTRPASGSTRSPATATTPRGSDPRCASVRPRSVSPPCDAPRCGSAASARWASTHGRSAGRSRTKGRR